MSELGLRRISFKHLANSFLTHKESGQTHPLSQPRQRDTKKPKQRRKLLMNKKDLMPQVAQPVNRITTGQLPEVLAELSEESLQLDGGGVQASIICMPFGGKVIDGVCSFDGDDAE
jgi:bacteriocin leader peptide (microcyclamide/patellamide family)